MAVCDFYGTKFNNLLLTDIKRFLSSCTIAFVADSIEIVEYITYIMLLIELFII